MFCLVKMSKIGKQPVLIPEEVEVKITEGRIMVKGPQGEEEIVLPGLIEASVWM